jgi:hypothetical protein
MLLTLLQSGGVGPGVITGSMAVVESGTDSFNAIGRLLVKGSMAVSETGVDSFSGSGKLRIAGNFALNETGSDLFVSSGKLRIRGTIAITETGTDVASMVGAITNDGGSAKPAQFAIRDYVAGGASRDFTARRGSGASTRRRDK